MRKLQNQKIFYIAKGIAAFSLAAMLMICFGYSGRCASSSDYPTDHGSYNVITTDGTADTFYYWSQVTNTKSPITNMISSENEDEPIRLMLVKTDESKYYEANWTKMVKKSFSLAYDMAYGASFYSLSSNSMINSSDSSFVTRGAQRSFIAEFVGSDKYNSSHGAYAYRLYAPNQDDTTKEAELVYKDTSSISSDDTLLYVDANNLYKTMGNSSYSDTWSSDEYTYNSSNSHTWWYMGDYSSGLVSFTAIFQETWWIVITQDSCDLYYDDKGLWCDDTEDPQYYDDEAKWKTYVGQPVTVNNLNSSKDTATITGSATIDEATYVPYGKTLHINEGASLIVDEPLILMGTIENEGEIIVKDGGSICYFDTINSSSQSTIKLEGGDLIVEEGGTVVISNLTSDEKNSRKSEIITYDDCTLCFLNSDLKNTICECNTAFTKNQVFSNYKCFYVDVDTGSNTTIDSLTLKFDSSKVTLKSQSGSNSEASSVEYVNQ